MTVHHLAGNWFSAFIITLFNPATVLAFMAIFGGIKIADATADPMSGFTTIIGVFVGAAVWWTGLTTVAAVFRRQIQPETLQAINRLMGFVISGFGIFITVDWVILSG